MQGGLGSGRVMNGWLVVRPAGGGRGAEGGGGMGDEGVTGEVKGLGGGACR